MADSIRITDIYTGIQHSGPSAGIPVAVVLFAGCRINCTIASPSAEEQDGQEITIDEVVCRVGETGLQRVLVAGGEPLLQEGCRELTSRLLESGIDVVLETHATVDLSEIDERVIKLIDLKCPSSGACNPIRWQNLALFTSLDSVGFVVADRGDYVWARDVVKREKLIDRMSVQMSPLYGALESKKLAQWILSDRLQVKLQIPLDQILAGLKFT